jgi:hypothetical protein
MNALMKIVFCTTCKNRTQHLEQTLPQNLADNDNYPDVKFVILDYNTSDNLHEYLQTAHGELLKSGKLVVYSHTETGPFQMAHAKNMAHRVGLLEGADILVNLDADNLTGKGFAQFIAKAFSSGERLFLWANMIKGVLPRGISGRIAVSRDAFLLSGGYDEKYATWGPDDKHFNGRLRRLGFEGVEIPPQYLQGVKHNDKLRFREYKHVETSATEEEFKLADCTDTVSNYGTVGCGVVYKNFDFNTPITLDPIPTRVFGIGLHKTATTSLHKAFEILGLSSAHWKNAHWAKKIWTEMASLQGSRTLEQFYCLSDLPFPVLYEQLDVAYPNSKFILTVRDEGDWIRSVRNHWSDVNKFKKQWDTDPFTHKIHRELYGQKGFNYEVFLQRYRKHNLEVAKYFEHRPDDFLLMDMDHDNKWEKLCPFLNCAIPTRAYPKTFVTLTDDAVCGAVGVVPAMGHDTGINTLASV